MYCAILCVISVDSKPVSEFEQLSTGFIESEPNFEKPPVPLYTRHEGLTLLETNNLCVVGFCQIFVLSTTRACSNVGLVMSSIE